MLISILPLLSFWHQFCAPNFHPNTSPQPACSGSCRRLRMLIPTISRVALTCSCRLHASNREPSGSKALAIMSSWLMAVCAGEAYLMWHTARVSWMLSACMPLAVGSGHASFLSAFAFGSVPPWTLPRWHAWMTWAFSSPRIRLTKCLEV